jgi:hypothetical protein
MSHHCQKCLIPDTVPHVSLDKNDVCNLCHEQALIDLSSSEQLRARRVADLETSLADCRGKAEYDAVVNLSGGKDSCLLLYKLKHEYGLNVLAFTTNMNIPDCAWKNIHRTVEKLGIHHITYTPPKEFYRKLFRFLLQHQEERGAVRTVCYVCAPLYEGYSLQLATEKGIPLVLAGYSPGQPDPDRMTYEFSRALLCETDWTPPEIRESELFSREELALFWNPLGYPAGTKFPRYLAPFHAWPYSQSEAMKLVVELGLIANSRNASPIHSNCPVNWLLMYSDLQNLGFNPYAPEFSQLIREGKANRLYWRIMGPIVNFIIQRKILMGRNVTKSLDWLGLTTSDLRITHRTSSETVKPTPPLGSVVAGCGADMRIRATAE